MESTLHTPYSIPDSNELSVKHQPLEVGFSLFLPLVSPFPHVKLLPHLQAWEMQRKRSLGLEYPDLQDIVMATLASNAAPDWMEGVDLLMS